jgi:hypothetical protein
VSTSATGSLYDTEMLRLLEDYIYYERDIEVESHFLHVETDDDEVDVEYYFFDDEFLKSPEAFEKPRSVGPTAKPEPSIGSRRLRRS